MIKAATLSALLASLTLPACATTGRDQLAANVAHELPLHGFDVDVATLTTHQIATINSILHSNHSASSRRGLIQSAIGGPNTLRGLIFGNR